MREKGRKKKNRAMGTAEGRIDKLKAIKALERGHIAGEEKKKRKRSHRARRAVDGPKGGAGSTAKGKSGIPQKKKEKKRCGSAGNSSNPYQRTVPAAGERGFSCVESPGRERRKD